MKTYILLLRGINIGGHKKIKMADLKNHLEELGFKDVETYIQSGNIIFKYTSENERSLAEKVELMITKKYGFEAKALVIIAEVFREIFDKNPYLPIKQNEIKQLYYTLLFDTPDPLNIKKLQEVDAQGDEFVFGESCLYFYYPNGYGNSKINNVVVENKLKVSATTRNWKTMNTLYEMSL